MDVGHMQDMRKMGGFASSFALTYAMILGQSWLFNLDVTIYGRTNHCPFLYNGKKVKLMSNQPKPPTSKKKVDRPTPEKKVNKGKEN